MVSGGPALGILLDCLAWLLPAFAIAWIFLRHMPLALLCAFAPMPGIAVEALLRFGTVYAYAFGFCVGLLLNAALLRRFLGTGGGWRGVLWAGAGAAATAAIRDWQGTFVLALSGASAAGLTALGWRYLRFDEAFIARANRVSEARGRITQIGAHIATPRWALSLSGIGLVMAALGWFEAMPHDAPDLPGFVTAAAMAFLLSRDWRAAAAAALCITLLWLFHAEAALPFFALPSLLLAAAVPARGEGAWRLVLEEDGPALLFAGASLLLLPWQLTRVGGFGDGVIALLAFAVALVFFPAASAALWDVFPRRRSVEELYRG